MTGNEYKKLTALINYHMDRYYNQDEPEISDYEYDQLMLQLKAAEKEHPEWVTPESPTQKIGGTVKREAGVKVTHNVPMLSIEDVFKKEDVEAWVRKVHALHPDCLFSVETKIDGLSMTLRYEGVEGTNGMVLTMAETRGDGHIGEDVTANAKVIPDVLKTLDLPFEYLELRGEVYMSHEDFERFNNEQEEQGRKTAANPRNLAAGTLRQLDTAVTASRGLRMFVFNVQDGPADFMSSHTGAMDKLAEKGVPVVYHELCCTADDVIAAIDRIGNMRADLPYDIDGAVVKLDNTAMRADFPEGSKYSAGHIAFKYPPEERPVVMEEIELSVGRTGKLGFVGHVLDAETGKPARLAGTNVSRVTLHNQDYINEMKVGIGGVYLLKKSGDIIPKLCGTVKEPAEIFKAPEFCPVCGDALVREEDTADIRCINPSCPAQLTRTISYFTSLNCMNIMGLGEALIDALIKDGSLKSYADIYHLKEHREELIDKGTIGKEKNTDKLLAAIEESKKNSPVRLLTALGIRNVGLSTSREIMRHYSSIEELMKASRDALTAIPDVGAATADCIASFFENEGNDAIIAELSSCGVNMVMEEEEGTSDKLAGLTIVITGTLPTLGRKEAQVLVVKNGGKAVGSVSKKTSYLLAGEAAGSKLTKAQDLGVPIISEEQFLAMIK